MTIGETYKRLCQQAQKAQQENREVSSTVAKTVATPLSENNRDSSCEDTSRISSTPSSETINGHSKRKNSEKDKRKARRNSEVKNPSKSHTKSSHKNEESHKPARRNSQHSSTSSKPASPTQTSTEIENSSVQNNKPPCNLQDEEKKHRCSSEEKPSTETSNVEGNMQQPSTSTSTPPLPANQQTTNSKQPTAPNDNSITNGNNAELSSQYKTMPCRLIEHLQSPIAQIRVFGETILASSEDGKIYTFNTSTLELTNTFHKHTEAITQMYLCEDKGFLFTTSLDGYMKKSQLEVSIALERKSKLL